MTGQSAIRFEGDLVLKSYQGNVAGEFGKARALWEVSQHDGFICPEPVALNEPESVIAYRNLGVIGNWVSVRVAYLDLMTNEAVGDAELAAIAEAGRVLGAIHSRLWLADCEDWSAGPPFRESLARAGCSSELDWRGAPQVCLHGDYGFSNVLWSRGRGEIATIDPSPDGYSTFAACLRGPAYVDLGQFVSCLEGRVPLSFYPRMKWKRLAALRDLFVSAYEEEVGASVDRDCVRRFGFAIAEANFRDRMSSRLGRRLASRVLYNRFKGNPPQALRLGGALRSVPHSSEPPVAA